MKSFHKFIKNGIFLLILIFFSSPITSKNIFFDLGGVILDSNHFKAAQKLGFKCIFYPGLQKHLFDFMCYIDPINDEDRDIDSTYKGDQMPPLLCKWQKGKISCKELSDIIIEGVDKNQEYFNNGQKTKQKLIKKSAELFLPENSVEIITTKKSMIKLANQLKEEKDKTGKPKHRLGIISNHDWETVQLIKKYYPEAFAPFDENMIIISSQVKMIKPNKNIYEYVIKKYNLPKDPKENIFIDDQQENVEAANKTGYFTAIKHTSTEKTKKIIKKTGALTKQ